MSRRSSTSGKYVAYSVDPISDCSSSGEEKEVGRIVLNSQESLDPNKIHEPCFKPDSPVLSSPSSTDKWGSYWSRRERCCCFLNFVFFVALAVMIAIVILSTKGIVDLRPNGGKESAIQQMSSTSAGEKSDDNWPKCTTPAPPAKDFYEFACGGFESRTRLSWKSPRKRSYPDLILEQHLENIADLLSSAVHEEETAHIKAHKMVYQSCMDTAGKTEGGIEQGSNNKNTSSPLLLVLLGCLIAILFFFMRVSALVDLLGGLDFPYASSARTNDITDLLASATKLYGVSPFFKVIVKDNNVMLLNRFSEDTVKYLYNTENFYNYRFLQPSDYYYGDEVHNEVLLAYKRYLIDFVATVLGLNETMKRGSSFTQMMDEIYQLEIYIHRVMYTEDFTNLSNKMSHCDQQISIRELSDRYNYRTSWSRFFTSLLGTSVNDTFKLCHVELSSELPSVLLGFSPLAIKRYIIITVLLKSDIYTILPERISRYKERNWEDDEFLTVDGTNLNFFCVNFMSKFIPYFFDKAPSMTVLESTRTLFSQVVTSLTEVIRSMYWIPLFQTEHLLKTFTGFNMRYIADIYNSSISENVTINQNFFDNFHRLITFKYRQYFRKNQWEQLNVRIQRLIRLSDEFIELSYAVLKPPLFYSQTSLPLFYGSFGTFVSQLLSEVFDLDALLKLLLEEKLDHRVALTIAFRLQCLVQQYSQYTLLQTRDTSYKIRGELSKSQNFKDSLALRVAFNAYTRRVASQTVDQAPIVHLSYPPTQLFFIGYAQTMCEKMNDRGMMMHYVQTDDISPVPGKFRVIGTLSNFKQFSSAFQCSKDSPMVRETECSLF